MSDHGPAPARGHAVLTWATVGVVSAMTLTRVAAVDRRAFDVDELHYRRTVDLLRAGSGYYEAMRDALVAGQGFGPGHVWAVRPPTSFWLFRAAEPDAWRWLAVVPVVATLAAVVALARRASGAWWAPTVAVLASWVWFAQLVPHLYLHAELWGLPLAAWGAVLFRDHRGAAAGLLLSAALVRETFVVALVLFAVAAVIEDRRWRPWAIALGAWTAALAAHAVAAAPLLDPTASDPPFWNASLEASYRVRSLLPGASGAEQAVAALLLAAGAVGLARCARTSAVARAVAAYSGAMALATVVVARPYWQAAWAPLVAAWVPAALVPVRQVGEPGGSAAS